MSKVTVLAPGEQIPIYDPNVDRKSMAWAEFGDCRGLDPEIFYPNTNLSSAAAVLQVERAKAICRECVVVEQCLEYAIANRENYGVWGGQTERERYNTIRRRQRLDRLGR